ncbi:hypothetical protein SVAN01_04919 [Stagonosporopsis vannaccii]|nr:hypothetical protein SVAN01_04919 [Stagonosporopsis vannaccii]
MIRLTLFVACVAAFYYLTDGFLSGRAFRHEQAVLDTSYHPYSPYGSLDPWTNGSLLQSVSDIYNSSSSAVILVSKDVDQVYALARSLEKKLLLSTDLSASLSHCYKYTALQLAKRQKAERLNKFMADGADTQYQQLQNVTQKAMTEALRNPVALGYGDYVWQENKPGEWSHAQRSHCAVVLRYLADRSNTEFIAYLRHGWWRALDAEALRLEGNAKDLLRGMVEDPRYFTSAGCKNFSYKSTCNVWNLKCHVTQRLFEVVHRHNKGFCNIWNDAKQLKIQSYELFSSVLNHHRFASQAKDMMHMNYQRISAALNYELSALAPILDDPEAYASFVESFGTLVRSGAVE